MALPADIFLYLSPAVFTSHKSTMMHRILLSSSTRRAASTLKQSSTAASSRRFLSSAAALDDDGNDGKFSIQGTFREGVASYLDTSATTPMDPRVLDKMMPYMVRVVVWRYCWCKKKLCISGLLWYIIIAVFFWRHFHFHHLTINLWPQSIYQYTRLDPMEILTHVPIPTAGNPKQLLRRHVPM